MHYSALTKRSLSALMATLLFIHASPSSAHATEATENNAATPEIVVTATKTTEDAHVLPATISTVSRESIERQVAENTPSLLNKIPGVTIEGAGMWEAIPVIRGFGQTRTLVLIDGHRQNNLWAGRDPLTPFINVAEVERIEVLKGPASVLYGSDALGGVINFITKKADYAQNDTWHFKPEAGVTYSSTDEGWTGNMALSGGGQGFDFRIDATTLDHENYTDGNGDEVANSQFEARSIGIQGRYHISDEQEISLSFRHNDIDDMGVPQKDNAPWSHFTKFDANTWKAAYTARELGIIEELQLKGWIVDQERVYDGRIDNIEKKMYTLKSNTIETGAKGTSLQLTFAPADSNTLVTGIEYIYEDAVSAETQVKKSLTNDAIKQYVYFPPVSDAHRNHVGIYAEDKHAFSNGSVLTGGIRYDYFSADAAPALFRLEKPDSSLQSEDTNVFDKQSNQAVTASLGYLYPLNSVLNLTTNLATGFRAPDIFERFSTRGGNPIIVGAPDLKPEYSWNIESGLKLKSGRLAGSFALFYAWVDDFISLEDTPAILFNDTPTMTYVNIPEARIYGFDGGLTWRPAEHISLFGTIASVIGKNRTDNQRLSSIPALNGTLGIRWEDQLNTRSEWWIELNSELFDDQDNTAPGEKTTPGYALLNLRTGISYNKDIKLSVAIDNLFDRTYRNHLSMADFLYEPGINIKTSINVAL